MSAGDASCCFDERFDIVVGELDYSICGLNSNVVYELGRDEECW